MACFVDVINKAKMIFVFHQLHCFIMVPLTPSDGDNDGWTMFFVKFKDIHINFKQMFCLLQVFYDYSFEILNWVGILPDPKEIISRFI